MGTVNVSKIGTSGKQIQVGTIKVLVLMLNEALRCHAVQKNYIVYCGVSCNCSWGICSQ